MITPFRTIQRGVDAAGPGDTIILRDGTYGNEGRISDGSGGMRGYATPVTINKAGAPDGYITIKAENKWHAILDCGTSGNDLGCDKYIYLRANAWYWIFQDLLFTRGAYGAIGTDEGASHIAIKGCFFTNIGQWDNPTQIGEDAIGFDHNASNWWIEGNAFSNIGRNGGVSLDHGIYSSGSNVMLINNAFFNITHGWAIQLANGAANWEIANNTFAFPNPGVNGQIVLWNQNSNISIENNIFYNPHSYAIGRVTSSLNGCTFKNNIVYGTSEVMPNAGDCGIGWNQLGTDPKLVSAIEPYNFQLQPDSPAIGAGIYIDSVKIDFNGNIRAANRGLDVGAAEFVDPSTAAGSSPAPAPLVPAPTVVVPAPDTSGAFIDYSAGYSISGSSSW